jgi:5-(carboxyamino)imidazole ribonucleotide mutase
MTTTADDQAEVGVIMGSDSDYGVMRAAADALAEFGVAHEVRVVSAHRTPLDMAEYAQSAVERGLRVIIAGAGGAAHLPGMVAALTSLPVIGVPVPLKYLDGMDSLLSIVQMPAGVPVATVSVGGARNAGLLAVRILAATDPALRERMDRFRAGLADSARAKDVDLQRRRAHEASAEETAPS